MTDKPFVSAITIYPIKGLDGIKLQSATIINGGCIKHDREYAISDEEGNFIAGKSNELVHSLRTKFDLDKKVVSFRRVSESSWHQYHLQREKSQIENYLSNYFGMKAIFNQNSEGRFLDIPDISGATVLSTSSLKRVSEWFNIADLEETRKRFRATVELDGVPAFWEDRLFKKPGVGIEFKAGDVTLIGMSPRARCVVPTRNPETGEVTHAFPKSFARHRAASLPEWSTLNDYGHHYYLSVDCYIPKTEVGKEIRVGEQVVVLGERVFYN